MYKVRNKVFETNSSSVHSISISEEGLEPNKMEIDKNGYINVHLQEFGKELNFYNSQHDKLSYLLTVLKYCSGKDTEEGIQDYYQYKYVEEPILEYTGAVGIHILDIEEGYLDHQSIPEWNEVEIINIWDKREVINFVFNRLISLKTTCD